MSLKAHWGLFSESTVLLRAQLTLGKALFLSERMFMECEENTGITEHLFATLHQVWERSPCAKKQL